MEKVLFSLKTLCFKVMVFSPDFKIFKLVCLLLCFCQLDCLAEHGEGFYKSTSLERYDAFSLFNLSFTYIY